jgi:hypothetical protein
MRYGSEGRPLFPPLPTSGWWLALTESTVLILTPTMSAWELNRSINLQVNVVFPSALDRAPTINMPGISIIPPSWVQSEGFKIFKLTD